MTTDPASRNRLLQGKLRALIRDVVGEEVGRADLGFFPGGAAGSLDRTAWVLAEDDPHRALGAAITWARRHAADRAELFVPRAGALLARRATCFDFDIVVRQLDGRVQQIASAAPPEVEPPLPSAAEACRDFLRSGGADPVVEGGVLRGEVLGLEVARVEVDETGAARVRIGVGRHDQEAHLLVHGEDPTVEDLFAVVRVVVEARVPRGGGHAAYHLAPERWLRTVVITHPDLAGAASLVAAPPVVRRSDLRQSAPAPAVGVSDGGDAMVVVCSVGVDVDLVPIAADTWLREGRPPRLVVLVPEGDDHAVTRELAALLHHPAEVLTVSREWRALS